MFADAAQRRETANAESIRRASRATRRRRGDVVRIGTRIVVFGIRTGVFGTRTGAGALTGVVAGF